MGMSGMAPMAQVSFTFDTWHHVAIGTGYDLVFYMLLDGEVPDFVQVKMIDNEG